MSVESIGIDSTANVIRQSELKKMIIYRYGQGKGTVPVFENIYCDSNRKCVDSFIAWGKNILAANPTNNTTYELFLFDEKALAEDQEEDDDEIDPENRMRPKRSKKKGDRIRFTFQLTDGSPYQRNAPVMNGDMVSKSDIGEMIAKALEEQAKKTREDTLLKKIAELEARIDQDYEDDEEIGAVDQTLDRVESIMDRVENFGTKKVKKEVAEIQKKKDEPIAVSGIDDISKSVGRDIKANINKAITILYKKDKDLDLDLLKLAKMSEENIDQFNLMINTLRKL